METKVLCRVFRWIGSIGIALGFLCLIISGAGDAPESYRMYLLCGAILVGSSLLSQALLGRRDDK